MKTTNENMFTKKRVIGARKLKSNRFVIKPATGLSKKAAVEKARKFQARKIGKDKKDKKK